MEANGRTILVADDDDDIRALVTLRLRRFGFEVVTAADGEQALALVRDRAPDLAILDVTMPGLTGLEVTRALRADEQTRGLPVLLLTARVQDADLTAGLEAGATGYVRKPFQPAELLARIEEALDAS